MLSEADLPLRLVEPGVYIDFLGPQDEPWLRLLLAEMAGFEGRPRRELAQRLAEPLACEAPYFKRRAATRVLFRLWRREPVAGVSPRALREQLFEGAAATEGSRAPILAATSARLGIDVQTLIASLFADLPGERLVKPPAHIPGPAELALRTNLAVAQAVLMRASTIRLHIEGAARPIVRLAKLRGLLCTVHDDVARPTEASVDSQGHAPVLSISGPFSLFKHTLLYGRALAELLPHLAWCARFELQADVALRGRRGRATLASGDPIFPADAPATFDSRLEERLARDLARTAPDWDIIREPEAVPADGTLIFPDFLLRHRIHRTRCVFVEVVGFWTPDYLTRKLERLRQARLSNLILCIDEERQCGEGALPPHARVVTFRRRVDAAAVMREVERLTQEDGATRIGGAVDSRPP